MGGIGGDRFVWDGALGLGRSCWRGIAWVVAEVGRWVWVVSRVMLRGWFGAGALSVIRTLRCRPPGRRFRMFLRSIHM